MKWSGAIGFFIQVQKSPGVYVPEFTERKYTGNMMSRSYRYQQTDKVNDDVSVSNVISIVSDAYIIENYGYIRYATYKGFKWNVDSIKIEQPRMILTLGGLFNENTSEIA